MSKKDFFAEAPPLPIEDQRLVDAYERIGRTLDDMPYTSTFDELVKLARANGDTRPESQIFNRLANLRKSGRLPRVGRWGDPPFRLTRREQDKLFEMLLDLLGSAGKRDRLPYTQEFDQIYEQFKSELNPALSKHDVWRLIARVAK